MARILHSQKAWEELAEDPFRGLRAGPATFSPFLFPASCEPRVGFAEPLESFENVDLEQALKCVSKKARNNRNALTNWRAEPALVEPRAKSELRAKMTVGLAGFGSVQRDAWNNPVR